MRRYVVLIGAGLALGLPAGALAKPAYVPSTLNLRAAPGTDNEIVAKIPAGSLVDADNCTNGWCAVTFQDKSGFAIETGLDLSGRVPPRRAAGPMPPPPPPGVYADGPVYVGPPAVYYGPRRYYYGAYPRYWGYPRYRW
jgi:hypothetical protein